MVGRPLVVLGLMSGTSADGIDGVLVHVPETPTLTAMQGAFHHEHSFTVSQRNAVFALFRPGAASAEDVCRMNFCLGEWFAEAALATLAAAGVAPDEGDPVGAPGPAGGAS